MSKEEVEPSEGERCPDCGGDGFAYYTRGNTRGGKCRYCDGTGRQPAAPAEGERMVLENGESLSPEAVRILRCEPISTHERIAALEAQLAATNSENERLKAELQRVYRVNEVNAGLYRIADDSLSALTAEAERLRSEVDRLRLEVNGRDRVHWKTRAEKAEAEVEEWRDMHGVELPMIRRAVARKLRPVLAEDSALAASADGQGKEGT